MLLISFYNSQQENIQAFFPKCQSISAFTTQHWVYIWMMDYVFKGALYCFGEEIQTQNLNIYNIIEVIQRKKYKFCP